MGVGCCGDWEERNARRERQRDANLFCCSAAPCLVVWSSEFPVRPFLTGALSRSKGDPVRPRISLGLGKGLGPRPKTTKGVCTSSNLVCFPSSIFFPPAPARVRPRRCSHPVALVPGGYGPQTAPYLSSANGLHAAVSLFQTLCHRSSFPVVSRSSGSSTGAPHHS